MDEFDIRTPEMGNVETNAPISMESSPHTAETSQLSAETSHISANCHLDPNSHLDSGDTGVSIGFGSNELEAKKDSMGEVCNLITESANLCDNQTLSELDYNRISSGAAHESDPNIDYSQIKEYINVQPRDEYTGKNIPDILQSESHDNQPNQLEVPVSCAETELGCSEFVNESTSDTGTLINSQSKNFTLFNQPNESEGANQDLDNNQNHGTIGQPTFIDEDPQRLSGTLSTSETLQYPTYFGEHNPALLGFHSDLQTGETTEMNELTSCVSNQEFNSNVEMNCGVSNQEFGGDVELNNVVSNQEFSDNVCTKTSMFSMLETDDIETFNAQATSNEATAVSDFNVVDWTTEVSYQNDNAISKPEMHNTPQHDSGYQSKLEGQSLIAKLLIASDSSSSQSDAITGVDKSPAYKNMNPFLTLESPEFSNIQRKSNTVYKTGNSTNRKIISPRQLKYQQILLKDFASALSAKDRQKALANKLSKLLSKRGKGDQTNLEYHSDKSANMGCDVSNETSNLNTGTPNCQSASASDNVSPIFNMQQSSCATPLVTPKEHVLSTPMLSSTPIKSWTVPFSEYSANQESVNYRPNDSARTNSESAPVDSQQLQYVDQNNNESVYQNTGEISTNKDENSALYLSDVEGPSFGNLKDKTIEDSYGCSKRPSSQLSNYAAPLGVGYNNYDENNNPVETANRDLDTPPLVRAPSRTPQTPESVVQVGDIAPKNDANLSPKSICDNNSVRLHPGQICGQFQGNHSLASPNLGGPSQQFTPHNTNQGYRGYGPHPPIEFTQQPPRFPQDGFQQPRFSGYPQPRQQGYPMFSPPPTVTNTAPMNQHILSIVPQHPYPDSYKMAPQQSPVNSFSPMYPSPNNGYPPRTPMPSPVVIVSNCDSQPQQNTPIYKSNIQGNDIQSPYNSGSSMNSKICGPPGTFTYPTIQQQSEILNSEFWLPLPVRVGNINKHQKFLLSFQSIRQQVMLVDRVYNQKSGQIESMRHMTLVQTPPNQTLLQNVNTGFTFQHHILLDWVEMQLANIANAYFKKIKENIPIRPKLEVRSPQPPPLIITSGPPPLLKPMPRMPTSCSAPVKILPHPPLVRIGEPKLAYPAIPTPVSVNNIQDKETASVAYSDVTPQLSVQSETVDDENVDVENTSNLSAANTPRVSTPNLSVSKGGVDSMSESASVNTESVREETNSVTSEKGFKANSPYPDVATPRSEGLLSRINNNPSLYPSIQQPTIPNQGNNEYFHNLNQPMAPPRTNSMFSGQDDLCYCNTPSTPVMMHNNFNQQQNMFVDTYPPPMSLPQPFSTYQGTSHNFPDSRFQVYGPTISTVLPRGGLCDSYNPMTGQIYREAFADFNQVLNSEIVKNHCRKKRIPMMPVPPSKKRRLNEVGVQILETWYQEHLSYPYPSSAESQELATNGNLSVDQVRKWFANRRMRSGNTRKAPIAKSHGKVISLRTDRPKYGRKGEAVATSTITGPTTLVNFSNVALANFSNSSTTNFSNSNSMPPYQGTPRVPLNAVPISPFGTPTLHTPPSMPTFSPASHPFMQPLPAPSITPPNTGFYGNPADGVHTSVYNSAPEQQIIPEQNVFEQQNPMTDGVENEKSTGSGPSFHVTKVEEDAETQQNCS